LRILLTFPPLWDLNLGPMLSLPVLASMLREKKHETKIIDINSYLMNFILSKDFHNYFKNKIEFYKNETEKYINENIKNSASCNNPLDYETVEYFKSMIKLFEKYDRTLYSWFIDRYPNVQTGMADLFKNNIPDFNKLCITLRKILTQIMKQKYIERVPKHYQLLYDWEQELLIPLIKDFNPDIIGFSIYDSVQYAWSDSFCEILKENTNAKIVYGGTQITQIRYNLTPDNFKNSADIMIYGEGENAFTDFAAEKPLAQIPSIIYLNKRKKVKINPQKNKQNNNPIKFYKPDYTNINLQNYFMPEPVLQIESSRGCYWHKCKFCTFMDCIPFKIKKVDDLIEEIKEYVDKYNINHFFFTDAAIHPSYAKEFSQKLIENNLKIYYTACLRLEKELDYDSLKLMFDGGLRMVMWGVESGSDKILKLYNKGTKVKNNAKILKYAHDIGIYNYCWVITQFAQETKEDLELTYKFLSDNKENIDFISYHIFTLMPNSPIAHSPESFGLSKEDFKILKMYKSPMEISTLSDKLVCKIMDEFKEKMLSYPNDISYILLKRAQQYP